MSERTLIENLRRGSPLENKAADEIERLTAEVSLWKCRWGAERRDHETTIKHANKMQEE